MRLVLFFLLLLPWIPDASAGLVGSSSNRTHHYDVDVSCLLGPIVKLSHHPEIREQLRIYNHTPHPKPSSLDKEWPSLTPDSPVLRAVLDNPATAPINEFITLISLRGEGMLIGKDGGLVAATNHTTDFWQGDEEQFLSVMNSDSMRPRIMAAHKDESTRHVLIKVSVPIANKNKEKAGVLVIGFDVMVMEFRHMCAPPS